jgi:hypothetical protein
MVMTLLFSAVASAFTLISTNPQQKGWAESNVVIQINPTNCPGTLDLSGLVNDSAKIWNRVSTTILKISAGDLTSNTAMSSMPVIYCSTTFGSDTGADPDGTLGIAEVALNGNNVGTGRIVLNVQSGADANLVNFSYEQIKIVIAHEIGHLIGLGHSEYEFALMYYNIGVKEKLNLSQDDVDGVTYLYTRDELGTMKPLGCGTVDSSTPSNLFLWMLLCLPLIVLSSLRLAKQSELKARK